MFVCLHLVWAANLKKTNKKIYVIESRINPDWIYAFIFLTFAQM